MAQKRDRDNKTGSEQYFGFMSRVLRAYGKKARAQEVDVDSLTQLKELREMLDEQTREVVHALKAQGFTWQQIGDALGIDRSNAYNKYAK